METKDIKEPSLWLPETDQMLLAAIGKLGEESAELAGICFRIIIQGIDGKDPGSGKQNRLSLQEEIADVQATSRLAAEMLELDPSDVAERAEKKYKMKRKWIDMIEQHYAENL